MFKFLFLNFQNFLNLFLVRFINSDRFLELNVLLLEDKYSASQFFIILLHLQTFIRIWIFLIFDVWIYPHDGNKLWIVQKSWLLFNNNTLNAFFFCLRRTKLWHMFDLAIKMILALINFNEFVLCCISAEQIFPWFLSLFHCS